MMNKAFKGTKLGIAALAAAMMLTTSTNVSAKDTPVSLPVVLEDVEDIFTDGTEAELEMETADFGFATLEGDFFDGTEELTPSIGPAICMYKVELSENDDPELVIGKIISDFENSTQVNPNLGTSMQFKNDAENNKAIYTLISLSEKCKIEFDFVEYEITVTLTTLN